MNDKQGSLAAERFGGFSGKRRNCYKRKAIPVVHDVTTAYLNGDCIYLSHVRP